MRATERATLFDDQSPLVSGSPTPDGSIGSIEHNRAIATGVLWSGALRWLSQVLAWTATIVVARRLSAEDYGIAGTATVFLGLLSLVTEGGVGRALVMRRERSPELIAQAHGASMLVGGAVSLLMLCLAIPLAHFFSEPRVAALVATLAIGPLLTGANAVPTAVLQQHLSYRRLAMIEFLKALVQAGSVLVGALAGLRYWSLAIGIILGQLTSLLATRHYVRMKPSMPQWSSVAPTTSYAQHLVLSSMAWYAYSSADFAVVGRVAGLAALGYYQFAWNIAQLPGEKLANVLQGVVGPFFGSIGDDRKLLRHYFLVLSELLMSIMLPVLFGFALVSPVAIPLIFGAKWTAAVPVLQILVACASIASLSLLSQHVLSATGQASVAMKLNLAAMAIMPPAFYIAAREAGPIAVAGVWLLAQPVLTAVPLLRLQDTIGLSVKDFMLNLRAPLIASLLMSAVVFLTSRLTHDLVPIVRLLALSSIGAMIYLGTFFIFFRPRVEAMLSLWRARPELSDPA